MCSQLGMPRFAEADTFHLLVEASFPFHVKSKAVACGCCPTSQRLSEELPSASKEQRDLRARNDALENERLGDPLLQWTTECSST